MKLALNTRSIAFRLITAVLAVELLSAILVVVLSFGWERHVHFHAFDVLLHGRADSILGAVQDAEDPGDNLILDKSVLHQFSDDIYEVYDADGHLLGRSSNWQGAGAAIPSSAKGVFTDLKVNGHDYRILRIDGARLIDPGDHGGKFRKVSILYGAQTSRVWKAILGTVEFYAAGSLFLLLVTGPLIAWLLHRGLLPLRQLAALAGNVSVDAWHFSPPPSARTTPELAPLTHALESVLQRLQRSFVQQQAFVSDAAHELKTAVAVVKSSIQLLAMKRRTPGEYEAGLERCLADSQRLEELVAQMLTLARLESTAALEAPSASPVSQASASLVTAIHHTIALLETVASLRQVNIHAALPETSPIQVPVSPDDLTLLLSNLLLNALQHSPPASSVELGLALEGQSAALTIQDHGEGIAPEILPRVFDRFYRGDPSRTRTTGGTGLGLAIAQAIAQKAGGSIHLASQLEHGTSVTVRLPIA